MMPAGFVRQRSRSKSLLEAPRAKDRDLTDVEDRLVAGEKSLEKAALLDGAVKPREEVKQLWMALWSATALGRRQCCQANM